MSIQELKVGSMTVYTKRCCLCKRRKLLTEFYVERNRPDGYCYRCKRCEKERRWKMYHENPEFHDRHVLRQRAYYIEHHVPKKRGGPRKERKHNGEQKPNQQSTT